VSLALTLRRARPQSVRKLPQLLLLYGTIFLPGAALTSVALLPLWRYHTALAMGSEFLSLALLASGVLLLDEPAQQRPAVMLMCSSALLTAGWLNEWHVGPLPLISVPASPLGIVLASWAMFRYPHSPREMGAGRRFFIVVVAWFAIGNALAIAAARPAWLGFRPSAWWPALFPDRALFTTAGLLLEASAIAFTVVYVLLWARRWQHSRGISRRLVMPMAVAASVVCAAQIIESVALIGSASGPTMSMIYAVEAYLQLLVPAAFFVCVMRRRFARTRIVDLLLHLRGPTRALSVTSALRAVFEDPELEVLSCPADTRAAADEAGRPPHGRGYGTGRLVLPITSSSGRQLAVILADPSLSPHDDLVRAAVAASSFALENEQLETALRAQLQEVQDSRLRIIEAGMTERRRLERDLHDGTQQRLLALKIMLAAAESDVTDAGAQAVIARVRSELGGVLDELRDLAHGIHPAVLSQLGLDQAIRSMAERYTIPIDVSLPAGKFGDAAELTAYFLIAESITNAIKHARARRITIRGERSGSTLLIEVSDDGQGGAQVSAGTGLRGVLDRVRGVGGDLELDSPVGHGTRVRAQIPCA
jgi:signal transduction histidine kinase